MPGVQFPEGDVFKWWHVAPDGRTALGPAHPGLGPAPVAALCGDPLCRGDGRLVGARRAAALPRGRAGAGRRRRPAAAAAALARDRRRLRPLPPRHRIHHGPDGPARPAADRHRRLERRHRCRRPGRTRRGHVAGLLLLRHPGAVRAARGQARGRRRGGDRYLAEATAAVEGHRGRLDRRPLHLRFRRRRPAARPAEHHDRGLAGAVRRGRPRARPQGAGARAGGARKGRIASCS